MKTKWLLVLIATTVLAITAVLNWPSDEEQTPSKISESFNRSPEIETVRQNEMVEASKRLDAQAVVTDPAQLELRVQEAKAFFLEAERELDALERELEDVERYVDDLEARGLNPAKYAEEGMELLNPVIDEYEARLKTVQAAEKELNAARVAFDTMATGSQ